VLSCKESIVIATGKFQRRARLQQLKPISLDHLEPCPYLAGRQKQFEYFFAVSLSGEELAKFLAAGWRKFGPYFFRPACPECRACIPVRVPVRQFTPSRSQRRVLRRNRDLQVHFGPLQFTARVYQLYREHARRRFGTEASLDEFASNFYLPSCPTLQSNVYLGEQQIGVGFLDLASDALSSVYFCFDPEFRARNLGTFGALMEIEQARQAGLDYYYLGYLVTGCSSMRYKDHFRPREYFDWERQTWSPATGPPAALAPEDPSAAITEN
jgi:leucyl-tRNA---protein transferase